jgi:hypothetical protein
MSPGSVTRSEAIGRHVRAALERSEVRETPFRHWLLRDVLPPAVGDAVTRLPFAPPAIVDTLGKRETHNNTRVFFSGDALQRFAVCADIAGALQDNAMVGALETACGAGLGGASLRIEYCQDAAGFWLEPHTDIGAKRFTMLIYLSREPGSGDWGTDVYDAAHHRVGRTPSDFGSGLIFIPGRDTWHGFERRPLTGVRRTLIVNYVGPEWRSRHELAYPDRPVGAQV